MSLLAGIVLAGALGASTWPVEPASATCLLGPASSPAQPEFVEPAVPLAPVEATAVEAEVAADCMMEADALDPGVLLVDMRPDSGREDFWLEGSLQEASVDVVATRAVFRHSPLAIFGSGLDDASLVPVCAQLRSHGSRPVHIVRQGIRALAQAGHPIVGDLRAFHALDVLDPAGLHQRLSSGPVRAFAVQPLSEAERAAFGPDVSWVDRRRGAGGEVVQLVVLQPGADLEAWRAANLVPGELPPLLYAAGVDAYRDFLSENTFKAAGRVRTAPLRCAG